MSYVGAAVTVLAIALAVAGSIPAYTDISIGDIDVCPVLDICVFMLCVFPHPRRKRKSYCPPCCFVTYVGLPMYKNLFLLVTLYMHR